MTRTTVCLGLFIWAINPAVSRGFDEPPRPTQGDAGPLPAADRPDDTAAWLRRLKDRDAEFDNRSIETDQLWVEKVSPRGQVAARRFNARRFGRHDPGSPPEHEIPDDFDQPHRLRQVLTVREPEVTIERREDAETMKHPEYVAIPNLGCRWSSAGGVERVWSPETNDLRILGAPGADGLLRWDAHMMQWCCGYGFAGWLESIESLSEADGKLTIRGRMRLIGRDDIRGELHLDRDLIVRQAVISIPAPAGSGAGTDEYVVRTRGTARPEGCPPVARSGRYRRILRPAGKPAYVDQDYEVRFVRASPRLTDEQYAVRTRIEPGPGAFVVDTRRRD